jgi:hypothetical protein
MNTNITNQFSFTTSYTIDIPSFNISDFQGPEIRYFNNLSAASLLYLTKKRYVKTGWYDLENGREHYEDGEIHNSDGPARVLDDGTEEWYYKGEFIFSWKGDPPLLNPT